MDTTNALAATVGTEAENLRRALRAVMNEATEALSRLDEGGRPGTSITGRLIPSASDVEARSARLDLLLNWSGSPLLTQDAAVKALKAGAPA